MRSNRLKLLCEEYGINIRKQFRTINVFKMGSLQSPFPRALNKYGFRYNPVLAQ